MSKQFYVYLLPSDVDSLVQTLASRLDLLLIQPFSKDSSPVRLEAPVCKSIPMLEKESLRVDCYIAPKDANIKMRFIPAQSHWSVQDESEVIEFRGCEFDGSVLVRGRFYYQTDILVHDMIAPKRKEFLTWADRLFRLTKRSLRRSKTLDAYVGESAEKWGREGGRFAWMVTPGRGPIYADSEQGTR